MVTSRKPEDLENVVKNYHVGAIRYHNTSPEELGRAEPDSPEHSRIQLLIASNCEAGGNGGVGGGTAVACGAATAAVDDEETAYEVAGSEPRRARPSGATGILRRLWICSTTGEIPLSSAEPSTTARRIRFVMQNHFSGEPELRIWLPA